MQRTRLMILAMFLGAGGFLGVAVAQEPAGDRGDVLFLVELAESTGSSGEVSLVLDVVFYGDAPGPSHVDTVLRSSLNAGIALHADQDIAARAWLRATPTSVKRRAISLGNGADGLRYVAQDGSVLEGPGGTPPPVEKNDSASEHLATVVGDGKVTDACGGVTGVDTSTLAGAALEQQGAKREIIVKAMRDWCKANDVKLDRKLRLCMSAISKAVIGIKVVPTISPEELTASIARGKTTYGTRGCINCHQSAGTGGPRGPDLTDSVWDHCDGSVASIADVIRSGVPRNKLKDSSRTSAMNGASDLAAGDPVLMDLSVYVHSLRK